MVTGLGSASGPSMEEQRQDAYDSQTQKYEADRRKGDIWSLPKFFFFGFVDLEDTGSYDA
jgi:hypothetical protein